MAFIGLLLLKNYTKHHLNVKMFIMMLNEFKIKLWMKNV